MRRRRLVRVPASSANLGPGFDSFCAALALHVELEVVETGRFAVETNLDIARDRRNLCVRGFAKLLSPDRFTFRIRSTIPLSGGLGIERGRVRRRPERRRAHRRGRPRPARRRHRARRAIPTTPPPRSTAGSSSSRAARPRASTPPDGLEAVLVVPHAAVRTSVARRALPATVPLADAVANVAHGALLTLGLATTISASSPAGSRDRLHQPYRAHLFPKSMALLARAAELGAIGATVSGRGPDGAVLDTRRHDRRGRRQARGRGEGLGAGRPRARSRRRAPTCASCRSRYARIRTCAPSLTLRSSQRMSASRACRQPLETAPPIAPSFGRAVDREPVAHRPALREVGLAAASGRGRSSRTPGRDLGMRSVSVTAKRPDRRRRRRLADRDADPAHDATLAANDDPPCREVDVEPVGLVQELGAVLRDPGGAGVRHVLRQHAQPAGPAAPRRTGRARSRSRSWCRSPARPGRPGCGAAACGARSGRRPAPRAARTRRRRKPAAGSRARPARAASAVGGEGQAARCRCRCRAAAPRRRAQPRRRPPPRSRLARDGARSAIPPGAHHDLDEAATAIAAGRDHGQRSRRARTATSTATWPRRAPGRACGRP